MRSVSEAVLKKPPAASKRQRLVFTNSHAKHIMKSLDNQCGHEDKEGQQ